MLVLPRDGDATLVVPRARGAPGRRAARRVLACARGTRPTTRSPSSPAWSGRPARVAIGDRTWARFVARPAGRAAGRARSRRRVDGHRPAAGGQGRRRGRGAAPGRGRGRPGRGRPAGRRRSRSSAAPRPRCRPTSAAASSTRATSTVNFAIVAAGENAASPHHEAGEPGDPAPARSCCATSAARCSTTRASATAATSPGASTSASRRPRWPRRTPCCTRPSGPRRPRPRSGTPCEDGRRRRPRRSSPRPATATASSTAPATASASRSTRTRTSSPATARRWPPGHAFSIEPGIYVPGRFGLRLEDIVVAADAGPDELNRADHALAVVDG